MTDLYLNTGVRVSETHTSNPDSLGVSPMNAASNLSVPAASERVSTARSEAARARQEHDQAQGAQQATLVQLGRLEVQARELSRQVDEARIRAEADTARLDASDKRRVLSMAVAVLADHELTLAQAQARVVALGRDAGAANGERVDLENAVTEAETQLRTQREALQFDDLVAAVAEAEQRIEDVEQRASERKQVAEVDLKLETLEQERMAKERETQELEKQRTKLAAEREKLESERTKLEALKASLGSRGQPAEVAATAAPAVAAPAAAAAATPVAEPIEREVPISGLSTQ